MKREWSVDDVFHSDTTRSALVLTAFLVYACGETSNITPTDAVAIDTLPLLNPTEIVRIGSVADPDTGFARIGSVAMDEAGNVYATETRDLQIRAYTADGQLIRAYGREGPGPGEFRSAPTIGIIGDTIWALEGPPYSRITLFHRSGLLLGAFPFDGIPVRIQPVNPVRGIPGYEPRRLPVGLIVPWRMHDDGFFISELIETVSGPVADTAVHATDTVNVPRVRFTLVGSPLDTVGWESRPPPPVVAYTTLRIGDLEYAVPPALDTSKLVIADRNGRYLLDRPVASSNAEGVFHLVHTDLGGDTTLNWAFRYLPVVYGDTLLNDMASTAAWNPGLVLADGLVIAFGPSRQGSISRDEFFNVRSAIRRALRLPRYQPPVQGHFLGTDGTLWLMREIDALGLRRWLVIAADGKPVGALAMPRTHRLLWASDDAVWIAQRDGSGDQCASTVAQVLVAEWFSKFGVPARIHSDQGHRTPEAHKEALIAWTAKLRTWSWCQGRLAAAERS